MLSGPLHGRKLGCQLNSARERPDYAEAPLSLDGAADHWNHREDDDYYTQPGALFRLMTPAQQQVLFENTARTIGELPREIQIHHIGNCLKADPAYGKGITVALHIELNDINAQ